MGREIDLHFERIELAIKAAAKSGSSENDNEEREIDNHVDSTPEDKRKGI